MYGMDGVCVWTNVFAKSSLILNLIYDFQMHFYNFVIIFVQKEIIIIFNQPYEKHFKKKLTTTSERHMLFSNISQTPEPGPPAATEYTPNHKIIITS